MANYNFSFPVRLMIVLSCASMACTDDNTYETESRKDHGFIVFGMTAASDDKQVPQSRVQHADSPLVLLDSSSNDTLYLHTSIVDNPSPASDGETRGIPVKTDNFHSVYGAFGVTAHTEKNIYMDDVKVGIYSGDIWSPSDGTHYWPGLQTLDFYAYAPYEYDGRKPFTVETDTYTDGKIRFSYEVPRSSDGNDAKAQPDLLFAVASCNRTETNNGCVPLHFNHALSAIRFVARDIAGGFVKRISIKNIHGAGDCVYDSEEFDWTPTGDPENFTQNFDVKVLDQENGMQEITDIDPATTFMMIPQILENDAAIEVVLQTNDGNEKILIGLLHGEWEAGKIYTYAISTESINWIYVFNVTETLTIPHGSTSGNYRVESYRYRAQNPDVREPLKWTATEQNIEDRQYVTDFKYAGNGLATGAEDYIITAAETEMRTTWNDNEHPLHDNGILGTSDEPYDLSTHDGALPVSTANCYVVSAAGTYSLPLVYGNAIKNGQENKEAYSNAGNVFYDHLDNVITQPYIYRAYTPSDCVLVWCDAFYLFKEVKLSDDKQSLIFILDDRHLQQANAIVAVRDENKRIMWSWHIWVTEHPLRGRGGVLTLQDWQDGTDSYHVLQCNLGWIDGKTVYYNERRLSFDFVQTSTGTIRTMTVVQEGAEFDYQDGGSLYYQWGRKDPIIGLKNRTQTGSDDYRLHEVGQQDYAYQYLVKQVSLGEAIQHPNIYYIAEDNTTGTHKWLTDPAYYLWDNRASRTDNDKISVKTIYDPSPAGFKIPPPRAFEVFVNGNQQASGGSLNGYQEANGYEYIVYTHRDWQGTPMKIVATGQRVDREKGLGDPGGLWAMGGVYYWSCYGNYANNTYYGHSLCIRNDANSYTSRFIGAQTMARPIRCIVEE